MAMEEGERESDSMGGWVSLWPLTDPRNDDGRPSEHV